MRTSSLRRSTFLTAATVISLCSPRVLAFGNAGAFVKSCFGRVSTRSKTQMAASLSPAEVTEAYTDLVSRLRRSSHLEGIGGLLGWDQQTMMPQGAEEARAKQQAALAAVIHEAKTDPAVGELLKKLKPHSSSLPPFDAANLRIASERFDQTSRMSSALAARQAELESRAYGAWTRARAESDWGAFAPTLAEVFEMQREICSTTKPDMPVYDAAIDMFDPKMTAPRIKEIFDQVKAELAPLISSIAAKVEADPSLHEVPAPLQGGPEWDTKKQDELCREIASAIGFDFEKGRMDVSVHPFTGGSHTTDVRITTRYSEGNWVEGVAGTIHECGHAMYEQGRPAEQGDLPVSEALGMASHESQSLLWERMVGQSLPFWKWATPIVHKYFPHTKSCTPEDFYRAVNHVRPSLIRVDADEVTYPLHVILRFELEKGVLDGELSVDELPALWDQRMKDYLGVVPPSAKEGVLQDVHWPSGAIGYFPSYTLGAMMANQIYQAAKDNIEDLEDKISKGQFTELKEWLNVNIHSQGSLHQSADDLLLAATGKRLDPKLFSDYLKGKYCEIYRLTL